MRFELTGVTPEGTPADSAGVRPQGKLTLDVARDVTIPGRVWTDRLALRLRSDFLSTLATTSACRKESK
jgi:hypothetical protein